MKTQVRNWEKPLAKETSDKWLLPKIYKELLKLNGKNTNHPVKTWAKGLNRNLNKKDTWMVN